MAQTRKRQRGGTKMSLSKSKKVYKKVNKATRNQVKKSGATLLSGLSSSKKSKKSKASSFFAKPTFLGRTNSGKVRKEKAPSLPSISEGVEKIQENAMNNGINALTSGFGGLKHTAKKNIANELAEKMKL